MTCASCDRLCTCSHELGSHEVRGGGLLGCIRYGCGCIDFAGDCSGCNGPLDAPYCAPAGRCKRCDAAAFLLERIG